MTIHRFFLIICLFLVFTRTDISNFAQDTISPTYTLVAKLSHEIVFQESSKNRVWDWRIPNLDYEYNYHVDSWTPDGCGVVILTRTDKGPQAILLSIESLKYTELPFGVPIWSPNGKLIFYVDSSTGYTNVYLASSLLQEPELFYSFDIWIGNIEWLSDYEWVFSDGRDQYYIWNLLTKQLRLFEPNPLNVWEEPSIRRFYDYVGDEHISPDWTMTTGFYNMVSYREAKDRRIFELSEEQIAEIEAQKPTIPGFDILFLETSIRRHVDVNGQFIEWLVWSPNSQQIAVTTDFEGNDDGIYVYDIALETLDRISDLDRSLPPYIPSWSPDSEWLAFKSLTGYEIQHLPSGQRIQLNEAMNQSQSLFWSPPKDVEEGCE